MAIAMPNSLTGIDWWDDEETIEKLASSDLPLPFIKAVIKEAAQQKEKQASMEDFEAAGRVLAHGYFDELLKLTSGNVEPFNYAKEGKVALANATDSKKLAAIKALLGKK